MVLLVREARPAAGKSCCGAAGSFGGDDTAVLLAAGGSSSAQVHGWCMKALARREVQPH